MRIAFLGFGLIGGSIARAVRAGDGATGWTIAAWTPTGRGPSEALADGVIDVAAATPAAAVDGADLVVLAGPVPACLAAMDDLGPAGALGGLPAPDAVVTDVASTKSALWRRATELELRYVGGHPMAGLESAGYRAARADLFAGRPWVIVPGRVAGPADVERVASLARACGAEPLELDADTHDLAVAGISHLPLLLSAALAEAVAGTQPGKVGPGWEIAARLAANGWRDMTRLARGEPAMGAGIAATNGAAIASRLRDLRAVLDRWQAELESADGPDAAAIEDRLRAVRARLDAS